MEKDHPHKPRQPVRQCISDHNLCPACAKCAACKDSLQRTRGSADAQMAFSSQTAIPPSLHDASHPPRSGTSPGATQHTLPESISVPHAENTHLEQPESTSVPTADSEVAADKAQETPAPSLPAPESSPTIESNDDSNAEVHFIRTDYLAIKGGVPSFNKIGIGIRLQRDSTPLREAMQILQNGLPSPDEHTPPCGVHRWAFKDMESFRGEDKPHAQAIHNASVISRERSFVNKSQRGVVRTADERGQVSRQRSCPYTDELPAPRAMPATIPAQLNLGLMKAVQNAANQVFPQSHEGGTRLNMCSKGHGWSKKPVDLKALRSNPKMEFSTKDWGHVFAAANPKCKQVIAAVGRDIKGHEAGRDPTAIMFLEGVNNAFQGRHADFHLPSKGFYQSTTGTLQPFGFSTNRHRWLCEFCVHARVLCFTPLNGGCEDVCFVYAPAGSFLYWRHDVLHGGTSHAAWRVHEDFKRLDRPIFSIAIHWYVDAWPEDDEGGKRFNAEMCTPRDGQGQQSCVAPDTLPFTPRDGDKMKKFFTEDHIITYVKEKQEETQCVR